MKNMGLTPRAARLGLGTELRISANEYFRLREACIDKDIEDRFKQWNRGKLIIFTRERRKYEEIPTTQETV